jgi:AsmA-like C-terminal region
VWRLTGTFWVTLGNDFAFCESKFGDQGCSGECQGMLFTAKRLSSSGRTKKVLLISAAVLGTGLLTFASLLHHYWPFTEGAIRAQLGEATSASVKFGAFHTQYFPPGCVAENVVFQRKNSVTPLITVKRLVITSYFGGLIRHRVSMMRAEGLHVTMTSDDFGKQEDGASQGKSTTVDKLVADDSVLDVVWKKEDQPLHFVFHKFVIKDLGDGQRTQFSAEFENPIPKGFIQTSGEFGPWNSKHVSQSPVSGKYALRQADLSAFESVAGITDSEGNFKGTFAQMQVEGSSKTPEFEVTKTHHKQSLETRFEALVNATNGDVVLQQLRAQYGKDVIDGRGTIVRAQNGQKAAIFDLQCAKGRVEDTFYPFIHSPKSPLTGDVAFEMHVVIPGGSTPFLRKLELRSSFRIRNARFTHEETEKSIQKIATSPDQKDPQATALSDFNGMVSVKNGTARFANISMEDQGASAWFRGNFNLIDERVDMHGKLKTEASLTKATHGIKAVFAKAIEPFFKKRPHETVVPVKISGTYSHPSFGLDVGSKM